MTFNPVILCSLSDLFVDEQLSEFHPVAVARIPEEEIADTW